ncbi:hypothetical protein ACFW1M_11735 [Streptomyces inhibens]|uniref:hypothetical protein n=1 Tax=Streptomyces inhibens TaxID=2293571 RepID=UPI0036B813D1
MTVSYVMTQEYAAVITAALAAIFLLAVVELSSLRSSQIDLLVRILDVYSEQIQAHMEQFRRWEELTQEEKTPVLNSLKGCRAKIKRLRRSSRIARILWVAAMAGSGSFLVGVIEWSAQKDGGSHPSLAAASMWVCYGCVAALMVGHSIKSRIEPPIRLLEQKKALSARLGESGTDTDAVACILRELCL